MRLMRFHEKLQNLARQRLLRNQEALAAYLGVNQTTVSRWLAGSVPHRSTAIDIAEKFGVPVDALLDDTKLLPFDEHLKVLSDARAQAASHPENPEAQGAEIDLRIAQAIMKREAERVRKEIGELAATAFHLGGDQRMWDLHLEISGKAAKKH